VISEAVGFFLSVCCLVSRLSFIDQLENHRVRKVEG